MAPLAPPVPTPMEMDVKCHKIIEIKSPYLFRDSSVEEACSKGGFYCTMEDVVLCLKRDHLYYYQIQGTMAIVGAVECDFVVWTPKSIKKETILFDKVLWENKMLPTLCHFYYKYMFPYLVY